ncbi:MAG TPA: CsgG/HfaB family protein [Tepidisphaeraceae bacterium]|jgi:TolB-like protein|nr:CsgG/HfaB family protein [Tepidisphaeraceae bacterium]
MILSACLLLTGGSSIRAADEKPRHGDITVAILNFDASTPGNPELGKQITDVLTATLSAEDGFTLVDRASMSKTLAENGLNLTGLVNADQAVKIGKLVGAKILVTGKVIPIDKQLLLTAKLIGTETSLVQGVLVKGDSNGNIGNMLMDLSDKVAGRLREKGPALIAQDDALKDPLPDLAKRLAEKKLPKLAVRISEGHVAAAVAVRIDPAARTEMSMLLRQAGFTVIDGDDNQLAEAGVAYVVEGEAFSEFGAQIANLMSCVARVEIKVVDRKTGEVIYTDRQTSRAVDLAENVAGKTALQKAGHSLGIKVLEHFAATLPAN